MIRPRPKMLVVARPSSGQSLRSAKTRPVLPVDNLVEVEYLAHYSASGRRVALCSRQLPFATWHP